MSQPSSLARSVIRPIKVAGSSHSAVKGSLATLTSNRRPLPALSASRAGSIRAMRRAISVGASGSATRATTVTSSVDIPRPFPSAAVVSEYPSEQDGPGGGISPRDTRARGHGRA